MPPQQQRDHRAEREGSRRRTAVGITSLHTPVDREARKNCIALLTAADAITRRRIRRRRRATQPAITITISSSIVRPIGAVFGLVPGRDLVSEGQSSFLTLFQLVNPDSSHYLPF